MKAFIKSLRLINAGFLLGVAFFMWVYSEEIDESARKRELNEEFNSIINKENTHA